MSRFAGLGSEESPRYLWAGDLHCDSKRAPAQLSLERVHEQNRLNTPNKDCLAELIPGPENLILAAAITTVSTTPRRGKCTVDHRLGAA
ncbi:hypothetical protein HYFRA_00005144 [Hymenoscyphus fraxineus]|uniref:Uncharacterized protein n=1 Tax=Hymenoscyphus fraxineus TaxID=746836 RepID=A0A9N9LBR7_9HELO|nr:hypothetical protein HYFRA_00005144 [Hymenoscyphus fraxineus]